MTRRDIDSGVRGYNDTFASRKDQERVEDLKKAGLFSK